MFNLWPNQIDMHSYETVTLTRDVDATRIPSGEKGFIPKGTEVTPLKELPEKLQPAKP